MSVEHDAITLQWQREANMCMKCGANLQIEQSVVRGAFLYNKDTEKFDSVCKKCFDEDRVKKSERSSKQTKL